MKKMGLLVMLILLGIFTLQLSSFDFVSAEEEDFTFRLNWGDASQNLDDSYRIQRENDTASDSFKIQGSIEYRNITSKVYEPGELTIRIDGIHMPFLTISDIAGNEWTSSIKTNQVETKSGVITKEIEAITFTNKERIDGAFTSTVQISYETPVESSEISCVPLDYVQSDISGQLEAGDIRVNANPLDFEFVHQKNVLNTSEKGPEKLTESSNEDNSGWAKLVNKIPQGNRPEDYIFLKESLSTSYSMDINCATEARMEFVRGEGELMYLAVSDSETVFESDETDSMVYRTELQGNRNKSYSLYMAFPRDRYRAMGSWIQTLNIYTKAKYVEEDGEFSPTHSDDIPIDFSQFDYVYSGSLYSIKITKNSTDRLYVSNLKRAFSKSPVLNYQLLKTNTFAADTGKTHDVEVLYDKAFFVFADSSYVEAKSEEMHFLPFGSIGSVPSGCARVDVYGKSDSDFSLIGSIGSDMTASQLSKLKSQLNAESYQQIKYIFRECNQDLIVENIYPQIALGFDYDSRGKNPSSAVFLAEMEVNEGEKDLAAGKNSVVTNISGLDETIASEDQNAFGEYKLRSAYVQSISSYKNYGISTPAFFSSWTADGEDTVAVINNNSYLYDYGFGTEIDSITTRFITPKGITTYGIKMVGADTIKTKYRFADTGEYVTYGYFRERTTSHWEKNSENEDVYVTVTDLSERPVATNYTATSNNYFYNFKVKVDDDVFSLLNLSGKTGAFRLSTAWETEDETITANGTKNITLPVIAVSTYQGTELMVRTGGQYTKDEVIAPKGGDYSYKLRLGAGDAKVSQMVFYCNLESGVPGNLSGWQGAFQGVDCSEIKTAGAVPILYYSENPEQKHDLSLSGWVRESEWEKDLSAVKSISVDLGDYILQTGSPAVVYIEMKAPDDGSAGEYAYNKFSVSYASYASALPDEEIAGGKEQEVISDLSSNKTRVILDKILEKSDELTIEKEIEKTDFYSFHGDISAIYKITSVSDPQSIWYQAIRFSDDDISSETLTKSITVKLPTGCYTVEELEVSRLQSLQGAVSGGVTWDTEQTSVANVALDPNTEEKVTFKEKKVYWGKFSHNGMCINRLAIN